MTAKIPEGFHTLTPSLIVDGAAEAIALYQKAFGATEDYRMPCVGSNKIMHACIQIGTSKVFLSDVNENGCATASASGFYVYFDDVDTAFQKAKQAGMQDLMPPQDMFWGDRIGALKDRFGNHWTIATHTRDVSPQEMEEGRQRMAAEMA